MLLSHFQEIYQKLPQGKTGHLEHIMGDDVKLHKNLYLSIYQTNWTVQPQTMNYAIEKSIAFWVV